MKNTLTIICLFLLSCPSLFSQSPGGDNSYRLFWYKGKRLKQNVLVTPSSDTVRYDPVRAVLKVNAKQGSGRQLDQLMNELDRTPQRLRELSAKMMSGLPKTIVPYYLKVTRAGFDDVQQSFGNALSNSIQLPAISFTSTTPSSNGHGAAVEDEQARQPDFRETLNRVLSYYEQYKNEKISYVPTPPRRELSYCEDHNPAADDSYERNFERFRTELVGQDNEIFQSFLELSRYSQINYDEKTRNEINAQLQPVHEMLLRRQYERAALLISKYADDPYRAWSVFKITLLIERQLSLVGWFDNNGKEPLSVALLDRIVATWVKMFEKAMKEYDYPVALSLRMILSVERLAQMHDTKIRVPLEKLIAFNVFKLNLHVSAKISVEGGYQLGEMTGDNWFSAIPDSSGRLQWILIGPLLNKLSMNLNAAEFRGKIDFPYIGTRKWEGLLPNMKIDFCDQVKDTLDVYMFYAEKFKETWRFPPPQGPIDILIMSSLFGTCFLDVDRINKYREDVKADPELIEKMKKELTARIEKMKQNGASTVASTGKVSAQQLALMADMNRSTMELMHQSRQMDPFKFVFSPKPHNKTPLVLQEKLDGKELFPQNAATEYAWFHLRLEQDPNSPFHFYLN